MKKIFKYELSLAEDQEIDLPSGSTALSVQVQNGIPCLWVLVDVEAVKTSVKVYTIGTGHPAPEDIDECQFVDTYQMGVFVFHVFIEIK